jgi:hypothetical protein
MTDNALERFQEAVQNEDTVDAMNLVSGLRTETKNKTQRERALKKVARRIATSEESTANDRTVTTQYFETVDQVEQQRLEFGYSLFGFVEAEADVSDLKEPTQKLIDKNKDVTSNEDSLRAIRDGLSIPPFLVVLGTGSVDIPKGNSDSIGLTVENVGGQPAEDISISTNSALPVETDPSTIDTLAADATTDIDISIEGEKIGESSVEVLIEGKSTSTDQEIQIKVAAKSGYLDRSLSQLKDLRGTLKNKTEDENKNKKRGSKATDGLLSKVNTAIQRIKRIKKRVDKKNPDTEAINNQIGSVINLLEAFINQTENLPEKQLDKTIAGLLIQDAEATIETLDSAQKAEID